VIRDRSEELHAFYTRHFAEPVNERLVNTNGHRSALTDEEVIKLVSEAKNGAQFEPLWLGDIRDYPSASEADQALISRLAFYTQDEEQLDRLYRQSGLCRQKWLDRPDYRRRTITRALSNLRETYTPSDDGARMVVGNNSRILSATLRDEVAAERIIRFRTAKEVASETPERTEWVAFPYLAKGAITEVDGKIKAGGKTTWISHMASCILKGEPFMGEPTTKTSAVFLTEQPPASFRKVLERAHLTKREDLYILHWHDVAGLEWSEVVRRTVEKAEEVGAGVLFVDTLGQFAGIRGDGENSAGEAHKAMQPLQEAAAKGLAVCITRHERKGGGEVGESGRGSSAFGGAVDIILSIRRADGNVRPTVRVIESLSRFEETPDKLVIELTADGYRSLGDATAFAEQEARQAILEVLPAKAEHALSSGDLFDKLKEQDIKRTSAQTALEALIGEGEVVRTGAGKRGDPYRYYRPAKDSAETSTYRGGRKNPNGQEDDEYLRTGFIKSEPEVFELAREFFDTHSGQGGRLRWT
jgi:NrS-1  polymerase HBD domain/AAA domain